MTSKRKHSSNSNVSSVNPLSDARRVQDAASTNLNSNDRDQKKLEQLSSKADLKAKELWHRKSGAGYQLFVEYYGGQPKGVIYDDDNDAMGRPSTTGSTNNANVMKAVCEGKGLSRAAKRRRKKKKIDGAQTQSHLDNSTSPSTDSIGESTSIIEMSPQFEQALKDKPECKHISKFLATMSQALPLTLRIRHSTFLDEAMRSYAETVVSKLNRDYCNLIQPVPYDATKQTIYQAKPKSNLTKFSLKKISPELKSLIMEATASGVMARQELGSMLPVIGLVGIEQMKNGSKVLDMCASPGSKTLQALEVVTAPPKKSASNESIKRKKGRIVANDIHPLRLESLQDAIGRSGVSSSLTGRIIYTNHDASKFPTPKSGSTFDCIIADVPCSGDGTIRKDPHILPGWMPSISNSLHELQKTILKRAMKLLKVGGVVAYSTCSLNPIEDEAVVASAMTWGNRFSEDNDTVELLDWPDHALPGFVRRPGVSTWKVGDYIDSSTPDIKDRESQDDDEGDDDMEEESPRLKWFETFEEAEQINMIHARPSMWPPTSSDGKSIDLEKCVRLWPQDNDTGGFFVALIRKNKEIGTNDRKSRIE